MVLYKSGDKGHHNFDNDDNMNEEFCPKCGKGNPHTAASDSVCRLEKGKRICVKTYHCSNCHHSWDVEE